MISHNWVIGKTRRLKDTILLISLVVLLSTMILNLNSANSISSSDNLSLNEVKPVNTGPINGPSMNDIENGQYPDTSQLNSYFIENFGQKPGDTYYYGETNDLRLNFGPSIIEVNLGSEFFEITFPNSNLVQPTSQRELSSYSNFFIGENQFTQVSHFAEVWYYELYDGIDLRYFWINGSLKYEFHVRPFAKYERIQMSYSGVDSINIELDSLVITKSGYIFADENLKVFYPDNHEEIASSFGFLDNDQTIIPTINIELEHYDRSRSIVIDPFIISYSTYYGGLGFDDPYDIQIDENGFIYMSGVTRRANGIANATIISDLTLLGENILVSKWTPDGKELIWVTILGGQNGDMGVSMSLDSEGDIYLTGGTNSVSFRTTQGAYQTDFNGGVGYSRGDAFVLKLATNGSKLIYSTLLGGAKSDVGWGITIDELNNAYVVGSTLSSNFPTTNNSTSSGSGVHNFGDAFLAIISPDGSQLLYSMYVGGSDDDFATSIALDSQNNIIFVGGTFSNDYPTSSGAFDESYNGHKDRETNWLADGNFNGGDVFVSKYFPTGDLIFSTYIGGEGYEVGIGLDIDSLDNIYITGKTESSNYPVTPGAFQEVYGGHEGSPISNFFRSGDSFVTKLHSDGSILEFSTYLGGQNSDAGFNLKVDNNNLVYTSGITSSRDDFPTTADANFPDYLGGSGDGYVNILSQDGSDLVYSSYYGGNNADWINGIFVNEVNDIYIGGVTQSNNIYVTEDAYQNTSAGDFDLFLTILKSDGTLVNDPPTTSPSSSSSKESDSPYLWNLTLITTIPWIIYRSRYAKKKNHN